MDGVMYAFILTLIAGISTGLGAVCVFLFDRKYITFLAGALAFSAGVMIYVSMIEIWDMGKGCFANAVGNVFCDVFTAVAFFAGMLIIALINRWLPSVEEGGGGERLSKAGMFIAFSIAIHNFPEGLATFMSALKEPTMGIAMCVAIAIHNIPEGIATAVPIYYAGKGRGRAFVISLLSGLTEPLGAVIGYVFLRRYLNDFVFGTVFSVISGIMVYVAVKELLPMAYEYDNRELTAKSFICGMAVMAFSLVLLG